MFPVPEEFLSIFFNHFSAFPVPFIPLCIFREQFVFYSPFYCQHFQSIVVSLDIFCSYYLVIPTGSGALFLNSPHITCICYIRLIPLTFSILLFLSFAPLMRIWMMFPWGHCCISTSRESSSLYIAWVSLWSSFFA